MTPARTTGHALVIDGIGVARDHYLQLAAQALSTGHDPITRHSPCPAANAYHQADQRGTAAAQNSRSRAPRASSRPVAAAG